MKPEHLGAQINERGVVYTIIGLRVKASRFPILCRNAAGKGICFPAEAVVRKLKLAAMAKEVKQ